MPTGHLGERSDLSVDRGQRGVGVVDPCAQAFRSSFGHRGTPGDKHLALHGCRESLPPRHTETLLNAHYHGMPSVPAALTTAQGGSIDRSPQSWLGPPAARAVGDRDSSAVPELGDHGFTRHVGSGRSLNSLLAVRRPSPRAPDGQRYGWSARSAVWRASTSKSLSACSTGRSAPIATAPMRQSISFRTVAPRRRQVRYSAAAPS